MTHEPRFGCRWQVIREHQETDPPIMCEDDTGPFVLYEHFDTIQARVRVLETELQTAREHVVELAEMVEYAAKHGDCRVTKADYQRAVALKQQAQGKA